MLWGQWHQVSGIGFCVLAVPLSTFYVATLLLFQRQIHFSLEVLQPGKRFQKTGHGFWVLPQFLRAPLDLQSDGGSGGLYHRASLVHVGATQTTVVSLLFAVLHLPKAHSPQQGLVVWPLGLSDAGFNSSHKVFSASGIGRASHLCLSGADVHFFSLGPKDRLERQQWVPLRSPLPRL